MLGLPEGLLGEAALVVEAITDGLARVGDRFDRHLRSDLLAVSELVSHVERYRGKMLRPTLVLACGLAAHPDAADHCKPSDLLTEHHITAAAVCEMVHMATLVHDDVLDEADVRRRGATVNRLRGNETAVILGDYLIAAAYHLCSTLPDQFASLAIGKASMTLCEGELLQLDNRGHYSLDEPTYYEIIERKTAVLIATACELGAYFSGASEGSRAAVREYGTQLGIAFQIKDDILDLTGEERVMGKPVGKDIEKGKVTLPLIHHLDTLTGDHAGLQRRGRTLSILRTASEGSGGKMARHILQPLRETGSIAAAGEIAASRIRNGKAALNVIADTPAKSVLLAMADLVLERSQ